MKLAIFLTGLLAASALAQQAPTVKVTSILHEDGTRTETTTNLEAGTSEAKTVTKAGKQVKKIAYKLDAEGLPSEGVVYNAKDQAERKFSYTRDPFGRIAEEINTTMDGKPIGKFVYTYNAAGRVTNIEAFDATGRPVRSGGRASTPAKKPARSQQQQRSR